MLKILPAFAIFLLFACGLCPAAEVGEPFPTISLNDVESGTPVDIVRALGGKVGAVVFMQTSCGVCKKELAALKELGSRKPFLSVLAVSIDSGPPARVANYKKNQGFPFVFLHDPEFEFGSRFGFKFTPGMVLTRPDGSIALVKGGYKPEDLPELEKTIDGLAR